MLPRVIVHNELSVDGRMDWLTPDMGLYYGLAEQLGADTMLSGSNTLLIGMPPEQYPEVEASAPASRDPSDTRLLLVVVDGRGQVRNLNRLRQEPYWRDIVVLCCRATPQEHLDYLRRQYIDYIVAGDERVDLRAALEALAERYGTRVVRVDSGGVLNGALLRAGLVDEVSVLVDPCLVGGTTPRALFVAADLISSEEVVPLRLLHLEQVSGDVVWLRYEVVSE